MDASWKEILQEELNKPYIQNLKNAINEEYKKHTIYPEKKNILRALELTPFNEVRVVILGQDCYFNPGQANGLAFAVNQGISIPPSLRNIFKEIELEYEEKP